MAGFEVPGDTPEPDAASEAASTELRRRIDREAEAITLHHPKTIAAAVRIVLDALPPEATERVRADTNREGFVLDCHFGMGMWIRNSMIHQNQNVVDLMADFQKNCRSGTWYGFAEPDDVSSLIVRRVWDALHGTYRHRVLEHLVRYKGEHLKVTDCGKWRDGRERTHILPDRPEAVQLNVLEPYREDFWGYHASAVHPIRLQRDFAHLNSSQAMCLNLFFPLVHEKAYPALLNVLGVKDETVDERESRFEVVLDEDECTNFDFHLRLQSGRRLLFEVKFTEQDYGTRKPSPMALDKVERIYRPRLDGKVPAEYLAADRLFANYQVLRNMSYLGDESGNHLFFVYPAANGELDAHRETIEKIGARRLSKCFDVVYLERLVRELRQAVKGNDRLRRHYDEFAMKYLCEDVK